MLQYLMQCVCLLFCLYLCCTRYNCTCSFACGTFTCTKINFALIPKCVIIKGLITSYIITFSFQEAFPEYPELLKLAVSLGRRMQEPLHVFTSLFSSPDNEFLALNLHPLQNTLPVDKLKSTLEFEIVNRVNDVGVDVNFAMEHPHTVDMLPYVCGLGPRKAPALIK